MMKKILPLTFILIGTALLITAVVFWIDSSTATEPQSFGQSLRDWITLIAGFGTSIKGWIDLFKKEDEKSTPTTQVDVKNGNQQIAMGENSRNIQTQTYIEKLTIARPATIKPHTLHQLPSAPADFIGREKELEQVLTNIKTHNGTVISGLIGLGGIGKTALGLVIAHKLAGKYPDAQVFLDLQGTTMPLTALDVMRYVIISLEPNINLGGVDEKSMASIYQSILHDKKIFLFFDNARSAEQITQLLPPESCALLVTSRWVFNVPGLQNCRVDVLADVDSKNFLLALCPRIGENASELAKACGYLPLALRIAGSFLCVNENWTVERYLGLMNNPEHRLTTIESSREQIDLGKEPSLISTFELTYQHLNENEQRFWKMLSIFQHPFNWQEAANLWEMDEDTTEKLLGLFYRYSFIEYSESTKTYRLHDFLVDYGIWRIEQAIVTSKKIGDSRDELKWTMLLALSSKNASNFRKAIDLYKRALTITLEITDRQAESTILNGLGVLYREIGEHNQSIESHEKALMIAKDIGNSRKELSALTGLGNEYHSLGKSQQSIEYILMASALAEQIGDRGIQAKLLNNLANSYEDFEPLRAIELFEKALIISQEVGDRLTEGNVLTNAGIVYRETGNIPKALEYQKRAQVIFQEIKDLDGEGAAFSNAGNCYLDLGQINDAIDCYMKLLAISQKTYYRNGEADALGNLGRAYSALGELDKAQEYLERQLRITQEIKDRMGEGNSLDEIGVLYISRNQPGDAINYSEQALAIFREINDKSGEAYALWNLGKAYKSKGDFVQAKFFGNQAYEIFQSISSHYIQDVKEWLSKLE